MSTVPESSGILTELAVSDYIDYALAQYEQLTYLSSGEISQLMNIDNVVISNLQWQNISTISTLEKTDGNILVGNGSTWVAESGATARTSLGLGSGSAVNFASVTVDNILVDANTIGMSVDNSYLTIRGSSSDLNGAIFRVFGKDYADANLKGAFINDFGDYYNSGTRIGGFVIREQYNSSVTEHFRVANGGNILIGTVTEPTPASRLVVKGSTNDGSTDIISGQDSDGMEMFAVNTDGAAEFKGLSVAADTDKYVTIGRGAIGYTTLVSDLFSISHIDNVGSTQNYLVGQNAAGQSYINCKSSPGYIQFQVGGANAMRITSAANFIINTTTDDGTNKLQVNGGATCANFTASGNTIKLTGSLPTSDPSVAGQLYVLSGVLMVSAG
jgi:hypothetical protein